MFQYAYYYIKSCYVLIFIVFSSVNFLNNIMGECKMQKNSIKMFLLLISIILVIAGCSATSTQGENESTSSDSPTKVVFWDLFSGNDGAVMTEMVNEFNKEHPSIKVEKITQEWGEYYTKLTTSVLGNKAPDLGISHATRVMQLEHEGVIQPMGEIAEANGINFDDLSENAVNSTIIEGTNYAVPLDYHAFLLFYNKKLLGDLNLLNDEGIPEFNSYEEFISLLEKVKEGNPDITPLALRGQGTHPLRLWYTFYKQQGGGDIYSSTDAKATIDKEIGKNSLEAVYDLYNTYKVVPPKIENIDEMFQSGKAAFMINVTGAVDNTYKVLGDDLGVLKFPTLFDKPSVYADSHTFILPTNPNRDEKTTKAAMTFVKWVTDNGWKWSKAGHLPVSKNALDSKELKNQPFRSEYEAESEYMEYLPPNEKVWFANSSELMDVLDSIWIKNVSVEEGLEKVEQVINDQLQD